jgi:flagellar protein FlgJ
MGGFHLNPPLQIRSLASPRQNISGKPVARNNGLASEEKNQRLGKACADFEAIFVEQLFKTMRASVPESELLNGGRAEEIYTSMLDQQIAQEMAHGQGSVGLADQMRNKLTLQTLAGTAAETKDG